MFSTYVISLKNSKERQKRFSERFSPEVKDFNWFYATRNNENPIKGCFDSHNQVLKNAKEKGEEYILVFEDDAVFIDDFDWKKTVKTVENFLGNFKNKEWKYFSLGYLPIKTKKTEYPGILEIRCAYDAHAYLVNVNNVQVQDYKGIMPDSEMFCQGIDPIKMNKNIHFPLGAGVYASYPMIFKQEYEDSSINDFHLTQKDFFNLYRGENGSALVSTYFDTYRLAWFFVCLSLMFIFLITLLGLSHFKPKLKLKKWFLIWGVLLILILLIFISIFTYNYNRN